MLPLAGAAALAAGCGDAAGPRPSGVVSIGAISPGVAPGDGQRRLTREDGPRFSGIAWTMIRGMSCSGAFVVPSADAPPADAPAYLLTAGHCVRNPLFDSNEVEGGADVSGSQSIVIFRHFEDSPDSAVMAGVRAIAFGTMKGLDVGIVELEPTRRQLRDQGVVPFVLSRSPSRLGQPIAIAGLPGLGYASLAACQITHRAPLVLEGAYHWFDYEANDCQGIVGGSSGSPVFSLETGEVLAVVNTVAEPITSFLPCMENHPCEASDGVAYAEGSVYAGGASALAGCFDGDGRFDLALAACPLDHGEGMQPSPGTVSLTVGSPPADIELAPAGLTDYRFGYGPAGAIDCRNQAAYGAVNDWASATSISVAASSVPGVSVLCLQAGLGQDPTGEWQDLETPTVITVRTWAP